MRTGTSFDPVTYTGDFAWKNTTMTCTPMTPEDLALIDKVCAEFDWVRVTDADASPDWWKYRIGPRHPDTPAHNHNHVINCVVLAGFQLRKDSMWPGIANYHIYKP